MLSTAFAQAGGQSAAPAPGAQSQPAPAAVAPAAQPAPAAGQPATANQTGTATPAATPPSSPFGSLGSLLPIVAIFVVFYFLLIMPQQRQRKKHMAMLTALKTGDKVVVLGGLHGVITRLRDSTIFVRIGENMEIEVERGSVAYKQGGEPPKT
jgi:preprotein translocase subunit YajC